MERGIWTTEFWISAAVTVFGAVGTVLSQIYGSDLPEGARIASIICGTLVTLLPAIFYGKMRTDRKVSWDSSPDTPQPTPQVGKPSLDDSDGKLILVGDGNAMLKKKTSGPGVIAPVLFIALSILPCMGCSALSLKKYDPATVEQIKFTVAFEEQGFLLTERALSDGALSEEEMNSLRIRHDSELARLKAWILSEEAKKVEDGEESY